MDCNLSMTKEVLWIDGEDTVEEDNLNKQVLPFSLNDIEVDDDDLLAESITESPAPGSRVSVSHEVIQEHEASSNLSKTNIGNSIIWLSGPLVDVIQRFLRKNTQRRNRHLILEYFSCLTLFFGEDRVPPDIAAVFEAIDGTDKTELGVHLGFDYAHQSQSRLPAKINQLSKCSLLDSYATKRLRYMLLVTLEMLREIADVSTKIQETMISEGCITISTPQHTLCQNITLELINLLRRMEILSSQLIKENLMTQEDIISAAKITYATWVHEIRDYIQKDIFYSMASQIECFYIITYESMVRLSACLCYCLELPDLSNIQYSKLIEITSDFAICVKDSKDNIISSTATYESNVISSKKKYSDANTSKLPSFSRESKVKRHCDTIINCSEEFTQHINNIKVTASLLTLVNEGKDSEHYKKSVSELKRLQEISFDYSRQLQVLLNTHSVLINDLSNQNTLNNVITCTTLTNKPDEISIPTELQDEVVQKDDCQPLEFSSSELPDSTTAVEYAMENKDEVFMGVFCNNCDDTEQFQQEDVDGKMVQQLYSGVVHQLKNALIPVKSKMKIREKEAVTKLYGNAQKDDVPLCDDDDSENSGSEEETEESSEDEAVPVKSTKNKYNTHRKEFEEDYNFPSHGSTFAGGDFMKELKFRLNASSDGSMVYGGVNEELICEPSSASESEDSD